MAYPETQAMMVLLLFLVVVRLVIVPIVLVEKDKRPLLGRPQTS